MFHGHAWLATRPFARKEFAGEITLDQLTHNYHFEDRCSWAKGRAEMHTERMHADALTASKGSRNVKAKHGGLRETNLGLESRVCIHVCTIPRFAGRRGIGRWNFTFGLCPCVFSE